MLVKTDLGVTREAAKRIRFAPQGPITATNVQDAIAQASTTPTAVSPTAVTAALSPYAVKPGDTTIWVDSSAGPVVVNLQPSAARLGVPLEIKDVGGMASQAGHDISIVPSGAETVDTMAPLPLTTDFGGYVLEPGVTVYRIKP